MFDKEPKEEVPKIIKDIFGTLQKPPENEFARKIREINKRIQES